MAIPFDPDEPTRYQIEFTEPALTEADALYLRISAQAGPEYAAQWYAGLFEMAATLSTLPRIHALARENDRYNVEIRRFLYLGPSRRHCLPCFVPHNRPRAG